MHFDSEYEDPLFDVLTVGDICVDLIVTGNVRPRFHQIEQIVNDCSLELGGSASICASQLGKLGANVGVIGWVGNDGFGQFVIEQLELAGVYTSGIRGHSSLKTGIGIALSEENDRAILTYMGTIDATRPHDLNEDLLRNCRHWHTASYFLLSAMRSFWPDWFRNCKQRGLTISLDTNWDPENKWEGVLDLLPCVDIFFPNEAEALAISQQSDIEKAAEALASRGSLVVVKLGDKGAVAVKGNRRWEIRPDARTGIPGKIVDATGAGDNFDAGFLHAYLAGHDIDACLLAGHRCAVASMSHAGGVRGQIWDRQMLSSSGISPLRYDKASGRHSKGTGTDPRLA